MRVPRYGALQSKFQDTQFLLITSASGPSRRWIGAYPGQGHIRKCHKVPWTCAAAWSSPVARRTTWPVAGERPTSGSVVGLFPLLELLDLLQELCLLVEALRFCPEFSRGLVLGAWRSGHGFSSVRMIFLSYSSPPRGPSGVQTTGMPSSSRRSSPESGGHRQGVRVTDVARRATTKLVTEPDPSGRLGTCG